jgi:hypothetical protein
MLPMMMPADTRTIGGAMDGYENLNITESKGIMVRWKDHEGAA